MVTPVKVGVFGFCLSLPIKAAGFLVFGLEGLAIAISTYYIINMLIMLVILELRIANILNNKRS
jgi:peptidoglycan biosynthesis protein MviN/MurJ (putative lipid II flippase)